MLVTQSCLTLRDLMDCSPQAPLSLGFSRPEHCSGLPFTSLRAQKLAITTNILGIPCGSAGKESTCNAGDLGSFPGWERLPTSVFYLENFMDCIVHGITKSQTHLKDFHLLIFCSQYYQQLKDKQKGVQRREKENKVLVPS